MSCYFIKKSASEIKLLTCTGVEPSSNTDQGTRYPYREFCGFHKYLKHLKLSWRLYSIAKQTTSTPPYSFICTSYLNGAVILQHRREPNNAELSKRFSRFTERLCRGVNYCFFVLGRPQLRSPIRRPTIVVKVSPYMLILVIENTMLRIFAPRKEEETGGWRKLHNEFFCGEGPRSRCYGRTTAFRLIVQHCDEDD